RGDERTELVAVCRLVQIEPDRALAAIVLPEEQGALGIFSVFVEGTDAARGAAAGWLYFDNISTQTCQRQPTILRLLVGQFDDAETGERTRAGRAVAADRTLVLCFHDDPPICARQWTVSSCAGIVACFLPMSTRPVSFPPKLIRKLAHSEGKVMRAIPLQEHLIVRIDQKCWTRCPTRQHQRRRLDLSWERVTVSTPHTQRLPGRESSAGLSSVGGYIKIGWQHDAMAPGFAPTPARTRQVIGRRGKDIGDRCPDVASSITIVIDGVLHEAGRHE